jgi:Tol biopolymer transport system component
MNRISPLLIIIILLVAGCSKGQPDTTESIESDSPSTKNRVSDLISEVDTTTFEFDPNAEVWRMHPQWAWYGSRIVFYEQRGSSSQIVVIDSNGNELVRTKASRGYAANPTWNDFGTKIAYSYAAEGVDGEWDLWRMNSDGTNPQLYIDLDDRVMHPAWDPTDAMLAFVQMTEEGPNIVVGNPRTAVTRQITFDSGEQFHPTWLDDQLYLIYDKTDGDTTQICKNEVFRREETCLFSIEGSDVSTPAASRNGAIIAFAVTEKGEGKTSDLWLYQVENGALFQLTDTPDESEGAPYWSPDGRWVVFHSDRGGEHHIYKIRIDQTERVQLTH